MRWDHLQADCQAYDFFHGMGLVVNDRAVIGAGVVLRHCSTISVRETLALGEGEAPMLEYDVDVGSSVVIVGPVRIGRRARVGADAVVTNDVPAGATAVSNPARILWNKWRKQREAGLGGSAPNDALPRAIL